jgi:hypothetical protein
LKIADIVMCFSIDGWRALATIQVCTGWPIRILMGRTEMRPAAIGRIFGP